MAKAPGDEDYWLFVLYAVAMSTWRLLALANAALVLLFGAFSAAAHAFLGHLTPDDWALVRTNLLAFFLVKLLVIKTLALGAVESILWTGWYGTFLLLRDLSQLAKRRLTLIAASPLVPRGGDGVGTRAGPGEGALVALLCCVVGVSVGLSAGCLMFVGKDMPGEAALLLADAGIVILEATHALWRHRVSVRNNSASAAAGSASALTARDDPSDLSHYVDFAFEALQQVRITLLSLFITSQCRYCPCR